ncbi:MAG: SH3 domain-containing protein [Mariprofundus sp.]|nr:SH3 domain-containing protein [Mariprofundus sp.]
MKTKRFIIALLLLSYLPSCVAVTALSAIPGSLVTVVADQFRGNEVSFAYSMRRTIATSQRVLQSMRLDIDILEIQSDGGYMLSFNNAKLEGTIQLRSQTPRLTTLYIKVKSRTREESVEQAIVDLVEQKLKTLPNGIRFQEAKYQSIMGQPSTESPIIGWFRPGSTLVAHKSELKEWLEVQLPSGKKAYLKGSIVQQASKL